MGDTEHEVLSLQRPCNLSLESGGSAPSKGKSKGKISEASKEKPKPQFKDYPYIKKESDEEQVEVINTWEKLLAVHDKGTRSRFLQCAALTNLSHVIDGLEQYTEKDLTLVKRGASFEIYTHREFEAKELVLVPVSTEAKECLWTHTRSVYAQNSVELHPNGYKIFFDSRGRFTPSELRPFCLFFTVTRAKEAKDCNMTMEYVKVQGKLSFKLPNKEEIKFSMSQDLDRVKQKIKQ